MKAVIIQARTGSSRLPGKVMMDLCGSPVLHHVVKRAAAIPGIEAVCCAIPDQPQDDELARIAEAMGAQVVRGPEQDVLGRYLAAARALQAEAVIRITSDCPLLDPVVSGKVLAALDGADYASNLDPRSWPKGLDTEAFTREALERAARDATAPYDREHVTPYLRREPGFKRNNVALADLSAADWRWTLDYAEDLFFLRALLDRIEGPPTRADFTALAAVIKAHPELMRINGHLV